ncbi:MAG: hypothetical protein WAR83_11440 [Flavobacteriales bacterium]
MRGIGFVLLLVFVIFGLPAFAQNSKAAPDSLKRVINELRTLIHRADSAQNNEEAMKFRVELAGMVPSPDAIKLLEKAASTASYLAQGEMELDIRTTLAMRYRSSGKTLAALNEMMRIRSLLEGKSKSDVDEVERQKILAMTKFKYTVDSLNTISVAERTNADMKIAAVEERAMRWQWAAIGFGVLWMLTSLFLFIRSGKMHERSEAAHAELRTELAALKSTSTVNMPTEPMLERVDPLEPKVDPSSPEQLDPVLVAMFRKMAPERLTTLDEALLRNDNEKVMRVVQSLRPQMMGMDPGRSAPLYAKLKTTDARSDPENWSALLTQFRSAVETLLARTGH